ncbi:Crp/Fnr family transcriptional regulator [Enterococcus timonensis]|uniref:Crp/Fnr family transcriptional regulator n=1 Tax=Enterococcus timonensis TaxID=1852364 RepID=UPI0008D9272E|nr:Crp/Fnr family transcriptional regulator [Enterococcus timonensis]
MEHNCVTLVPLFNHLETNEQETINQLTHHEKFQKGETILSPLEEDKLVIVARGQVKLYQLNANGKEQLLRVMEPGDFEGDKELFGAVNNSLYGEAMQETTICMINQKDFQQMLLEKPEIALRLLQLNAQKMVQVEKQAQFLTSDSIEERLASYLIDLSKAEGSLKFTLPFKMKELAAFIGTTPETLSRKMRQMEDDELFQRRGRMIQLNNLEDLEDL